MAKGAASVTLDMLRADADADDVTTPEVAATLPWLGTAVKAAAVERMAANETMESFMLLLLLLFVSLLIYWQ